MVSVCLPKTPHRERRLELGADPVGSHLVFIRLQPKASTEGLKAASSALAAVFLLAGTENFNPTD